MTGRLLGGQGVEGLMTVLSTGQAELAAGTGW